MSAIVERLRARLRVLETAVRRNEELTSSWMHGRAEHVDALDLAKADVDEIAIEIDRLTRENVRLIAGENGFRKEGEMWRDVANAHALKILDLTRERASLLSLDEICRYVGNGGPGSTFAKLEEYVRTRNANPASVPVSATTASGEDRNR